MNINVCIYAYVYINIYKYIHTYIYIYTYADGLSLITPSHPQRQASEVCLTNEPQGASERSSY